MPINEKFVRILCWLVVWVANIKKCSQRKQQLLYYGSLINKPQYQPHDHVVVVVFDVVAVGDTDNQTNCLRRC